MGGSIADELYSGILKDSTSEPGSAYTGNGLCDTSTLDAVDDDLWYEDSSSFEGATESSFKASDMDRDWLRRHDQFHTIGYRDGLIAGKDSAAQEGFNIGFKESVFVGRNLGLVRGVTRSLVCLPDGLRERLVETEEKRIKFQHLHDSVHSLSTTDALKLFHDGLTNRQANAGAAEIAQPMEDFHRELQSLVRESPAIKLQIKDDQ